jgi:hypothetical protein
MLWLSEVWEKFTNFSDESSAFTFKIHSDEKPLISKILHDITPQETMTFVVTAMKNSTVTNTWHISLKNPPLCRVDRCPVQ